MNTFSFWWRMIRPHTLSASIVPVIVGTAFALKHDHLFVFYSFIAMLLASLCIQIATNLFNEYFDYINGVDTPDSIGNSGTIVRDGASPRFVMGIALLFYFFALLFGIYLCVKTSWILALVGAICMLFGFLYGGGPYPISRTPVGELFAGGFMGSGIILISFYIQTGYVNLECFLVSVPIFILIGLILTANSLRDRINDIPAGRKTLAILLGHEKTVYFMTFSLFLAYFWLILLFILYANSLLILLPLFSLPVAIKSIKAFQNPKQTPQQMMPAMASISKTNQLFGNWYALSFVLAFLIELNLQ